MYNYLKYVSLAIISYYFNYSFIVLCNSAYNFFINNSKNNAYMFLGSLMLYLFGFKDTIIYLLSIMMVNQLQKYDESIIKLYEFAVQHNLTKYIETLENTSIRINNTISKYIPIIERITGIVNGVINNVLFKLHVFLTRFETYNKMYNMINTIPENTNFLMELITEKNDTKQINNDNNNNINQPPMILPELPNLADLSLLTNDPELSKLINTLGELNKVSNELSKFPEFRSQSSLQNLPTLPQGINLTKTEKKKLKKLNRKRKIIK
jgi:hypothetical protein